MRYEVEVNGRVREVTVHRADGRYVVSVDGREHTVDAARVNAHTVSLLVGGASHDVSIVPARGNAPSSVRVGATSMNVSMNGRRSWGRGDAALPGRTGPQRLVAPMPGKIVRVLAQPGDAVKARQAVVVVEAMKMENELRAPSDGIVTEVPVREGQSVDTGAVLAVILPDGQP